MTILSSSISTLADALGKGRPYDSISFLYQPALRPNSILPLLITSKVESILAVTDGILCMFTKMAPSLIFLVKVASEDNVVQHSRMGSSEFGCCCCCSSLPSSSLLEKYALSQEDVKLSLSHTESNPNLSHSNTMRWISVYSSPCW